MNHAVDPLLSDLRVVVLRRRRSVDHEQEHETIPTGVHGAGEIENGRAKRRRQGRVGGAGGRPDQHEGDGG